MAPTLGFSTLRALKVKKENERKLSRSRCFSYWFASYLHARSCNHFLSFPHTPRFPRPLKRPWNFISFFGIFSNLYFFSLLFRAHLGYGTRSSARAILFVHSRKALRITLRRVFRKPALCDVGLLEVLLEGFATRFARGFWKALRKTLRKRFERLYGSFVAINGTTVAPWNHSPKSSQKE